MEDTGLCLLFHLCEYFGSHLFQHPFCKNIRDPKQEMNNHPTLQNRGCARISHVPLSFFLCSLWPTFPPLRAYSKSTHLVKSSGNPDMPGCGNIGGYCLKTREQERAGDARQLLELFGSCTGRDPAPAKLGRKSPTSEVWSLDPLVQQPAAVCVIASEITKFAVPQEILQRQPIFSNSAHLIKSTPQVWT